MYLLPNIDYLAKLKYHIYKKGCEASSDSMFRIHYMITGDIFVQYFVIDFVGRAYDGQA